MLFKLLFASCCLSLFGSSLANPQTSPQSNGGAPPASGSVQNGRYHHDQTGLEFTLPAGFSVQATDDYMDDGWQAILADSDDHNAT